jgi:putative transposase
MRGRTLALNSADCTRSPSEKRSVRKLEAGCRREMLDQVIPLNERHLRRLLREYASYHDDDRIDDALNKDAPNGRPVDRRPSRAAGVISQSRLGGLHHRYTWAAAA